MVEPILNILKTNSSAMHTWKIAWTQKWVILLILVSLFELGQYNNCPFLYSVLNLSILVVQLNLIATINSNNHFLCLIWYKQLCRLSVSSVKLSQRWQITTSIFQTRPAYFQTRHCNWMKIRGGGEVSYHTLGLIINTTAVFYV